MIFLILFIMIPFFCYIASSSTSNYSDELNKIRENTKQNHLIGRQVELLNWNTPKKK